MSNIYRRLHPEEPAYTVTGRGGGGTHMYHYDEPRALTNREKRRKVRLTRVGRNKGIKEQKHVL
ncbi:hypothetical protein ACTHPT_04185 [Bacillus altitudinis]|uniref:hypothetical protein n=1 Tax=Bacillus altitudinis TaxID=293387 RepID=UPI002116F276|nr:hypothetical protein [Bacillus altitudinis]